ncbi:BURP domain-containing protein BNM2A [Camellia lanceoleosa]|uniref:BURP domain-containing protein BNM2A n=1 Tax=Camellia lanceoleosa TaxID=1840588 RepID=A0ACC0ITD0_9ERIC|nr:BURP domain-containing protein BNM2A [Camellia lanceoleosa]
MAIGYTSWSVLLYLLLVMSSHGIGAMKMIPKDDLVDDLHHNVMNALKYPMIDNQGDHAHGHGHNAIHTDHVHAHSSSHMDDIDPSLIVFFFLEDLKVGKKIPIYFPKRDPSYSPHFLPKEESDSIPFSLEQLPNLLQIFSFSHGSPQAQVMESTLRQCEVKPIKGESKTCAISLESMLDFVGAMLALEGEFKVVSTIHFTESTTILQNYIILSGPKMVACHTMPYPYAIFYCHYQESESKVFKVFLGGENGDRLEAVAVCHKDTSQWSPGHVSFQVLGIEPGSSPVCHFFPSDNLVWIASSTLISHM